MMLSEPGPYSVDGIGVLIWRFGEITNWKNNNTHKINYPSINLHIPNLTQTTLVLNWGLGVISQ
jgi:hypothetical protein